MYSTAFQHFSLRFTTMPTSYHKRQTPITKRMAEDMLVRNLAPRTIDSYTYHVDRFARHFGKLPEDLGPEQIREFQLWLIQVNEASWSQFNQAVCAYASSCLVMWKARCCGLDSAVRHR